MLAVVAMVSVDEPPEVTEDGLNDAVAPLGRPDAENVTVCAVPLVVAVATVVETEPPAVTEPEVGESETEKSLPVEPQGASLPATFTAVHAAWTVLYSVEQLPYRSVAALRV
ncbi:hypothetical protein B0E53_02284 [Micromonospora sp. MH33]|nr:hypothetical protein B0E53_02284 [Micromonospora sp. MH33]